MVYDFAFIVFQLFENVNFMEFQLAQVSLYRRPPECSSPIPMECPTVACSDSDWHHELMHLEVEEGKEKEKGVIFA